MENLVDLRLGVERIPKHVLGLFNVPTPPLFHLCLKIQRLTSVYSVKLNKLFDQAFK